MLLIPIYLTMQQYKERMEKLLPNLENLSIEQLKFIISKYWSFVELLSFWSVMWYAYYRVKSEAWKEALIDNIECEWKDSHQMMLNNFLLQCDSLPNLECQKIIRTALVPSWKLLQKSSQENSAFVHIVFLTLAENTSLAFIPRLAKSAEKVLCRDFTYTDVHWEADIKHAQLFEKALYDEKAYYNKSAEELEVIVEVYFELMRTVFSE